MPLLQTLSRAADFCLTVFMWAYFLIGYLFVLLVLFIPFVFGAKRRDIALQKANHVHLKIFFALTRFFAPGVQFCIDAKVRALRSSIIVCNHISYLDPILLVSLFERHTTIVKNTFFSVPIFGWFLKKTGYVPSDPSEMEGGAMIGNLEAIKEHLAGGGNLFVFPEGTRSRNGRLAPFNKGVFSIARYCNTGVKLVMLSGTDRLFQPGTFIFHMRSRTPVSVKLVGSIMPDYQSADFSINRFARQAREVFEQSPADRQGEDR
jgi:1-acyl-sn-glycerol-3-phosphate acyltransferase